MDKGERDFGSRCGQDSIPLALDSGSPASRILKRTARSGGPGGLARRLCPRPIRRRASRTHSAAEGIDARRSASLTPLKSSNNLAVREPP